MVSRVFRVGATVVVLGLLTTTALAQGAGRGGPGGGRGFPAGGTASDLLSLLSAPEIRQEVGLSEEGAQAVDKLLKESEEARGAMFPGRGGPDGPGDTSGDEQSDPKRWHRNRRLKDMQERLAESQKKADQAVLDVLSDDQKKALEELKGKKFEFPESLRLGAGMMGGMMGRLGGGGGPAAGGPAGGGPAGGGFELEKLLAMREEMAKKAQDTLDEVLPPEGLDRLLGLYVQLRGNSSITGELPAKKLGLSPEDITKINEISANIVRDAFRGFGRVRPGRNPPGSDSGS